jgi:hypothetical protein
MKTKTTILKSALLLLGAIIVCSTLTSCSTGKLFTGNMKYTYYKKVKANNSKETFSVAQASEQEQIINDSITMIFIPVKSNAEAGLSKNLELVSSNSLTSNSLKHTDHNEYKKSVSTETKMNKVKRICNEKINRWFPSKSNTLEQKNPTDNIIVQILIALVIIALLYILIVAAIYLLLEASGFILQ